MSKDFKQTLLSGSKDGCWTKLIQSGDSILIKQFDGDDIETVVITKEDIAEIIKLI